MTSMVLDLGICSCYTDLIWSFLKCVDVFCWQFFFLQEKNCYLMLWFCFVATDVVTVYVFQEPSLLSSLQDSGLTDVVLHALLIKDVSSSLLNYGLISNSFSPNALCISVSTFYFPQLQCYFKQFFSQCIVYLCPCYYGMLSRFQCYTNWSD